MRSSALPLKNEAGFVTGMMLFMLAIFTVLGVSAIVVSITEMSLASNDQFFKTAFYSAEAARGYVPHTTDLYGVENTVENEAITFPDKNDATVRQSIGSYQEFNGEVMFNGSAGPPRGSGFEVGTFRAHKYQMTCNGYGPRNSQSQVVAGFYRVGF
ncbi:PilX N-terminal domain-containing pilus assembly protein [Thermodesulfobacteriota bacterium]